MVPSYNCIQNTPPLNKGECKLRKLFKAGLNNFISLVIRCITVKTQLYYHTVIKYYISVHIKATCFGRNVTLYSWPAKQSSPFHRNDQINQSRYRPEAWSGPEGSRKLRFPDFMTTAQGGGKVVSLTHRPHLPPGNSPGTHLC
jgi:hypothetical protein